MTPQERIIQHQKMIEQIRQDIAWLEDVGFELRSPNGGSVATTADLVAQQQKNIEMYEGFIARLKEQSANA